MPDLGGKILGTVVCSAFMFLGWHIFVTGLRAIRVKRFIQDIPTANIKTGAIGTCVEVKGEILVPEGKQIKAPISGESCKFYQVVVKRHRNDIGYDVYPAPGFFMEDDSEGVALVIPHDADFRWKEKEIRGQCQISGQNLPGREWFFNLDDPIYIYGFAKSPNFAKDKASLENLFSLLIEGNNERYSNIRDSNCREAKEEGRKWAKEMNQFWGEDFITKNLQRLNMVFTYQSDFGVFIYDNPIISNLSEEEVAKNFGKKAWLYLINGPILFISFLILLLHAWGLIDWDKLWRNIDQMF